MRLTRKQWADAQQGVTKKMDAKEFKAYKKELPDTPKLKKHRRLRTRNLIQLVESVEQGAPMAPMHILERFGLFDGVKFTDVAHQVVKNLEGDELVQRRVYQRRAAKGGA